MKRATVLSLLVLAACSNSHGPCPDSGTAHDEVVNVVNETVFRADAEECFAATADCSSLCRELANYHTGRQVVVSVCERVADPNATPTWSLGTTPDPADGLPRLLHVVYEALDFCGA